MTLTLMKKNSKANVIAHKTNVHVEPPELSDYMANKYGKQWEDYEKKVPWKMIPGLM